MPCHSTDLCTEPYFVAVLKFSMHETNKQTNNKKKNHNDKTNIIRVECCIEKNCETKTQRMDGEDAKGRRK